MLLAGCNGREQFQLPVPPVSEDVLEEFACGCVCNKVAGFMHDDEDLSFASLIVLNELRVSRHLEQHIK